MTKALIFDSGTLINLSMNGLLYLLEELKKNFGGEFVITRQVKYEVVDRPMNVQRFELGAMQVQALLDNKTLILPDKLGVDDRELTIYTQELMDMANHFIQVKGNWISIVSDAEISCIALSDILKRKGYDTMIALDERTTRILGENPDELEQLMSEKLHQRAELVSKDISIFASHKFIRSSELVYVAFKKNLIRGLSGKKALEALLYATKYKGAAISFDEINQLKKL